MIKYIIYEIDDNHLKSEDLLYGEKQRRVCYLEAKNLSVFHDTEEEALKEIEDFGKDFTEYTIIKRIYKTNY